MLKLMRESYENYARGIDWRNMTKSELANAYLDATDEFDKESYFAACMLKYWYFIYQYAKTCKSCRLEIEDFTSWVAESLLRAFKYKAWRNPKNTSLYNDINGAEKVINRCLFSTKNAHYQYNNMDKRKVNFITESLDKDVDEDTYYITSLKDVQSDYKEDKVRDRQVGEKVDEIIKYFINSNRVGNAIIVANICYSDNVFKKSSRANIKPSLIFTEKLLRKSLRDKENIDMFSTYFSNKYGLEKDKVLNVYKKLTSRKSNSKVRELLNVIRNDSEVINILCC